MITKSQITALVEEALENTDRFIVDIIVKNDNTIYVILDSDTAITIENCVEVSRFLESKLDRDVEDYELHVSSAGLDHAIFLPRQFQKNLGKLVDVLFKDGEKRKGKLVAYTDETITIEEVIIKKYNKLKKEEIGETLTIPLNTINEIKVVIIF